MLSSTDTVQSPVRAAMRHRFGVFWMRYGNWGAFVLVFVLASLFSPRDLNGHNVFLKPDNLVDVLRQISEVGILAVGMTLVVLLGGIDLSVGAVVGLGSTIAAELLVNRGLPTIAVFPIVLVTGLVVGLLNSGFIVWGRVQPFVVTLAAMTAIRGAARLVSDGNSIAVESFGHHAGQADPLFALLAARLFGDFLPVPVIILLLVVLITNTWMSRTVTGRYVYATGGNLQSAILSGLPVKRITFMMYGVCSLLAALTGMIHAAQFQQANPATDGDGYELLAIAATVIGGASLFGGRGTVVGALAGALIIGVIDNFLGIHNVNSHWRLIIQGLIILVAVLLQRGRES